VRGQKIISRSALPVGPPRWSPCLNELSCRSANIFQNLKFKLLILGSTDEEKKNSYHMRSEAEHHESKIF
jgi:hypothetical protein